MMLVAPAVLLGSLIASQPAMDYDRARAAEIKRCDAIDPGAYQTGLAFNPDGYRSFYLRSECLQKAAIFFRDAALCRLVKQRRALLSSSWGYSPGNCRTLVAHALDADRAELEALKREHRAGAMVLQDFRIERNGNGRDYDAIPAFAGARGHGYTIAVEIVRPGSVPVVVHANGYYVDPRSALRLFIRRQEIAGAFPAFEAGRSYQVRMLATFTLPAGGGSRYLSDSFLERMFPLRERVQSVTRDIRF